MHDNDPLEMAYRRMVAETMTCCPELSRGERMAKRENDAVEQALLSVQAGESVPESVDRGAA